MKIVYMLLDYSEQHNRDMVLDELRDEQPDDDGRRHIIEDLAEYMDEIHKELAYYRGKYDEY